MITNKNKPQFLITITIHLIMKTLKYILKPAINNYTDSLLLYLIIIALLCLG